jgi:hypothetical protein
MLREMAILISTASAIYVWLSVICAPLLSALATIARDPLHSRAWRAGGLALSTVILWTTIAAALMLLVATLAPRTALELVTSPVLDAALVAGSAVWIARCTCMGLPRLGRDAEIASALAVVSLFRDDLRTLQSVEALYRERVLAAPDVKEPGAGVRVATI